MPQATLEEDIVFGEIAVKNQILSVQQVSECLRVYQKLEDKTFLGLPQICIQRGYLSAAQAQSLVRARNFLVKHREDVKIAELLHGQRVVRSHQIRYAFRLQEQAYYSGALVIPRLIDILDDEGILARDIAEDALAAGLRAENMTENDLVVSVDDLPDLAIPEEVERELHVNGIEAVQKIAQDESGFLEQLQRLEHTLPAEKGRFRVDDYIKQLPKAETSPLASSVIRHDLLRKTGEVKAARRKVREVTKAPRAFYRFNVRDSYVEYATSSWIPILPSMKSSHSPIIDVSLGGIQLATPYEFDVGEKLNLDIHIPFLRRSLRSKGEVRWFEEFEESDESGPHCRVGVEFTKLSKDGIECLKRLAKSPALRGEKRRKK